MGCRTAYRRGHCAGSTAARPGSTRPHPGAAHPGSDHKNSNGSGRRPSLYGRGAYPVGNFCVIRRELAPHAFVLRVMSKMGHHSKRACKEETKKRSGGGFGELGLNLETLEGLQASHLFRRDCSPPLPSASLSLTVPLTETSAHESDNAICPKVKWLAARSGSAPRVTASPSFPQRLCGCAAVSRVHHRSRNG